MASLSGLLRTPVMIKWNPLYIPLSHTTLVLSVIDCKTRQLQWAASHGCAPLLLYSTTTLPDFRASTRLFLCLKWHPLDISDIRMIFVHLSMYVLPRVIHVSNGLALARANPSSVHVVGVNQCTRMAVAPGDVHVFYQICLTHYITLNFFRRRCYLKPLPVNICRIGSPLSSSIDLHSLLTQLD